MRSSTDRVNGVSSRLRLLSRQRLLTLVVADRTDVIDVPRIRRRILSGRFRRSVWTRTAGHVPPLVRDLDESLEW